jgi:hypothetical protein
MASTMDINDEVLVRYLLGVLAPEETEPIDELSIADDAFAARLTDVENDLVDAYVRGDLPAATERQFNSVYLSSPRRRRRVKFAEAFRSFQLGATAGSVKERARAAPPENIEKRRGLFGWLDFVPQWGLAAAVAALVILSGYLSIANRRLIDQVNNGDAQRASLEQQEQKLEDQLKNSAAGKNQNLGGAENSAEPDHLNVAAFVLLPPTRGASQLPSLTVSPNTDLAVFELQLESSDFAKYRASLEDSATRKIVWQSGELTAVSDGRKNAVSVAFRASLLERRNYVIQLRGMGADGAAELVSSYPFRAVVK